MGWRLGHTSSAAAPTPPKPALMPHHSAACSQAAEPPRLTVYLCAAEPLKRPQSGVNCPEAVNRPTAEGEKTKINEKNYRWLSIIIQHKNIFVFLQQLKMMLWYNNRR